MTTYDIWLAQSNGTLTKPLYDFASLAFSLNTNNIGVANLVLPGTTYTASQFSWMSQLRIERGGILQGTAPFFVTNRELTLSDSGEYLLNITAQHSNILLHNRHVMSYAGSSYSEGDEVPASNLMRQIVRDSLGAAAAHADRDKAGPLNVVTVEADDDEGSTISKSFARRRGITVLQEIANASKQDGSPLFFGIIESAGTLTFVVRAGQWGTDRTGSAIISSEFGNLTNTSRETDWTEHLTVAYALGGQTGVNRLVKIAENTTETAANDLYFVEGIFDNANELSETALQDDANALLTNSRVDNRFGGNIQETTGFLYDTNWSWGDKLGAANYNETFNVWLSLVQTTISGGQESRIARLEVE